MHTLEEKLAALNNPRDIYYTSKIREIIFGDTEFNIPEDYLLIVDNGHNNTELRFSAFYCLFTQFRRFEQRYFLFELVEKYMNLFDEEKYKYLCEIIWSQYYKFKFMDTAHKDMYKNALEHAKKAIACYATLSDNIGCFNNYADIVLDAHIYKDIVSKEDVAEALKYVNHSIYIQETERKLSPNPQYYYRKAKLLSIQKKYDEAKKMIAYAISYSKPDDRDALIRIANYHNTQLEIETEEALSLVDENVEESMEQYKIIMKQMEQQQVRYIEILGFFASVIALLIGTISIALAFDNFNSASGLLIVLSGSLMMAYSVLKILFSGQVGKFRILSICLLSLVLMILGILLGNGIPFNILTK